MKEFKAHKSGIQYKITIPIDELKNYPHYISMGYIFLNCDKCDHLIILKLCEHRSQKHYINYYVNISNIYKKILGIDENNYKEFNFSIYDSHLKVK